MGEPLPSLNDPEGEPDAEEEQAEERPLPYAELVTMLNEMNIRSPSPSPLLLRFALLVALAHCVLTFTSSPTSQLSPLTPRSSPPSPFHPFTPHPSFRSPCALLQL